METLSRKLSPIGYECKGWVTWLGKRKAVVIRCRYEHQRRRQRQIVGIFGKLIGRVNMAGPRLKLALMFYASCAVCRRQFRRAGCWISAAVKGVTAWPPPR